MFYPHEILFIIYNAIYILPVLYVTIFGFAGGGVSRAFSISSHTLNEMMFFYFVMILSFFLGSRLLSFGSKFSNNEAIFKPIWFESSFINFAFILTSLSLIVAKILLIPEGVYSNYAFDSGAMASKFWSVSMGITELMICFFILFLFTGNEKKAHVSFLLICINLAHGTRIFTLICLFIYLFYLVFYKRSFSKVKLLVISIFSSISILVAFLFVFITRSGVEIELSDIDFDMLVSPLVYESIFNQISFVRMLDFFNSGVVSFAPHMFAYDSVIFSLPRAFGGREDIYINAFGILSPLGGLSGYASAILYFSSFYFIWYFLLGMILTLFFRASRSNFLLISTRFLYVYMTCDTLFRLNRDPYFISIKMLWNNIFFVFLLLVIPILLKYALRGSNVCKS